MNKNEVKSVNKKIRKAVRTYLIKDNKIVVINYKQHDNGYYDIPGGKIEDNETPEETSIREFKEETGMNIAKQHDIGKTVIEFPDKIFDFNIFIVDEYNGEPLEFDENKSITGIAYPESLSETPGLGMNAEKIINTF